VSPSEPVSLAIVNARVWTNDARRPWADGVAVRGDRIAAVGSSAEIRKMSVASTRVIDAKGRMLVPGAHGADAAFAGRAWQTSEGIGTASIARGESADFTLIDRDLSRSAPEVVGDAPVMLTVAAGRVVFER
jgi:predicted amidohydrolase YtcJ